MRIVGIDRVTEKMQKLSDADPTQAAVQDWLNAQATKLQSKAYPPERPNQRYVRTGNLGRSWVANILSSQATGKAIKFLVLLNRAPYARYVVDRLKQAWMHRGRWWTAQEALEENRQDLIDNLSDRYGEVWNR